MKYTKEYFDNYQKAKEQFEERAELIVKRLCEIDKELKYRYSGSYKVENDSSNICFTFEHNARGTYEEYVSFPTKYLYDEEWEFKYLMKRKQKKNIENSSI